mgnify:CR=1 FL=1
MSGPFASTGRQIEAAVKLYQQKFGDSAAGRKVEILLKDDGGVSPDVTKRLAQELVARDKTSLDIFWLKDDSLADSDNLPAPGVIAQEIVEDLQAALEQFRLIAADMTEGAIE